MSPIVLGVAGGLGVVWFGLTISAISLAVWPTKYVPAAPDRKQRDWPVIAGLYAGGFVAWVMAALVVEFFIMRKLRAVRRHVPVKRYRRASTSVLVGRANDARPFPSYAMIGLLCYALVDEAVLIPSEGK